jgi:hypothetical protein
MKQNVDHPIIDYEMPSTPKRFRWRRFLLLTLLILSVITFSGYLARRYIMAHAFDHMFDHVME